MNTSPVSLARVSAQNDFRIGDCLKRSAVIWSRNWFLFVGAYLIFYELPKVAERMIQDGWLEFDTKQITNTKLGEFLFGLPSSVISYLADAIIAITVLDHLQGRVPQPFKKTLSDMTSITLAVIAFAVADNVVSAVSEEVYWIPWFVFFAVFWLSIPIIANENLGVLSAMRRSYELTSGYRWRVLGLMLVVVFFWLIVEGGAVVVSSMYWDVSRETMIGYVAIFEDPALVLVSSYLFVCLTVAYFDIRNAKEVDSPHHQILEAFD